MVKKIFIFLLAIFGITLTSTKDYAQTNTSISFPIFSNDTHPIYIEAFPLPFITTEAPIAITQASLDTINNRYYFNLNLSPNQRYYLLIFQSMDNSIHYDPFHDLSLFDTNQGGGYSVSENYPQQVRTLIHPLVQGYSYTISHIESDSIQVSLHEEDNAINFNSYSKELLNITLSSSNNQFLEKGSLDSHCNAYYCGNITASFLNPKEGNYDISINYGDSSLIYIPNALHIISPSISDTPTNGIKSSLQKDVYIPKRIVNKTNEQRFLIQSQLPQQQAILKKNLQKQSIFELIMNHIQLLFHAIVHAIRSII